jgi:protein involved in polysaccharide export with SLBB domain
MPARTPRTLFMALRPRGSRLQRTLFACAGLVWSSALWTGCGSLPPTPVYPEGTRALPLGLTNDPAPSGTLRAGDQLAVEVTAGKEARIVLGIVDARGDVHVGSGQDVRVGGLSLQAAEERVTKQLQTKDKFAEVNLQLASRPTQRVSVLGAVLRPGYLELGPGMRVVDVIAATGGLLTSLPAEGAAPTPVADLDDAVLVRDGKALPISVRKAMTGAPGHNVRVHPGDQLYVPFATDQVVAVLGQVTRPGVFVHHEKMRLSEALGAAGGITVQGDKSDIRVVRGTIEEPKVYQSSLAGIVSGNDHDSALAPGDVVFVQDDLIEDFAEVANIVLPLVGAVISAFALSLVISQ